MTPVLDEVKRLGERARRIADLYIEKQIPLAMVASMSGGEALGLSQYVRRLGHDIVACLGNAPERLAAERLAREASDGAVLDFYTAWIAVALDLLPLLKALFGKLILPRSAIDTIGEMQREAVHRIGGESMSLGRPLSTHSASD